MNNLSLEAAAGVYSGTVHDAKPHPIHIERNKAFKAGAEWQRNHVWHKATEMPIKGEHILACITSGNMTSWYASANIEEIFKRFHVKSWAYADDILPDSPDKILNDNNETE